MKYDSFDDWFWEIENFATRGERFYDELQNITPDRAVEWLKAAWECGRIKYELQNQANERSSSQ